MILTETEASGQALLPVQQIEPPPEETSPGWRDLLGSALRTQNTVMSAGTALGNSLERMQGRVRQQAMGEVSAPDAPRYNPIKDIGGYEQWAKAFINSESSADTFLIKRQIDRELLDRQTLESGGAAGVVAQIAAGVVDPVNIIPFGGAATRSARLGEQVLSSGLRAAATGAAASSVAEAALQSSQATRMAPESVLSIGAATLLSGVLGAAAPLVRELLPSLSASVSREMKVPTAGHDPLTEPGTIPISGAELPTSGSAGAMRVNLGESKLKSALGVEKLVANASPAMRTAMSPSIVTRRTAQELVEQPFRFTDEAAGIAAPVAVETRIKFWNAPLAESLQELDRLYAEHLKGAYEPKLSRGDFREAVGIAMRQSDMHPVPDVERAAAMFRKKIFDPLKESAIRVGLLPEGVEVKGAPSYLSRVYNVGKINAQRDEFVGRITKWLQSEQDAMVQAAKRDNHQIGQGKMPPEGRAPQHEIFDPVELRDQAEQITDHVLGTTDGRIAYENVQLQRGPTMPRTLDVPDIYIQPFLENDVEMVAKFYTRTLAPDVELARAFKTPDMAERIDDIRHSYVNEIDRASTEQEKAALGKRRDADLRDLTAMRDRLRGTYGAPADPSGFFVRGARVLRNWNYLSMMGSMALPSSIPDLARAVMVHGMWSTLRDGIVPLVTGFHSFKLAANEAKLAGTALDMVLDSRAMDLADIGDVYGRHSTFERGLQAVVDRYGKWTLMSAWNTALKNFASVIGQHNMLRSVVKGEGMSAKEMQNLAFGGIDKEMAVRIAAQFAEHGDQTGSAWVANTRQWSDREAVKHFRAAIVKDVDRTIVTPGAGDRPLWMSSELGKVVGQFHTFAFASVQRVLVSGLQQRDMAVLNGTLLSIALGAGIYGLHSWGEKKPPSDDPKVWIREGVDRSGITGWLYEVGNIVEKFTRGGIGPKMLSGGDVSLRYADRGLIGALLGPSIGRVEDLGKATGAAFTNEFSESDVRSVRRLIPFQNLFYMRWLFDKAQEGAAAELAH